MRLFWHDLIDNGEVNPKKPWFNMVCFFQEVYGWDDICAIIKKLDSGTDESKLILKKYDNYAWQIAKTFGENFYAVGTNLMVLGIDKNLKGFFRRNM